MRESLYDLRERIGRAAAQPDDHSPAEIAALLQQIQEFLRRYQSQVDAVSRAELVRTLQRLAPGG